MAAINSFCITLHRGQWTVAVPRSPLSIYKRSSWIHNSGRCSGYNVYRTDITPAGKISLQNHEMRLVIHYIAHFAFNLEPLAAKVISLHSILALIAHINHRDRMTHICIGKRGHGYWFNQWLVACCTKPLSEPTMNFSYLDPYKKRKQDNILKSSANLQPFWRSRLWRNLLTQWDVTETAVS